MQTQGNLPFIVTAYASEGTKYPIKNIVDIPVYLNRGRNTLLLSTSMLYPNPEDHETFSPRLLYLLPLDKVDNNCGILI